MGTRRRALVLGVAGAIAVITVLLVVVGADRVLASLRTADSGLVGAVVGLGVCWLAAWSLMLRRVLVTLDIDMPAVTAFFVYAGAVFANNVTPFGQAGGEPVAALLISEVSGTDYETGLVGIATVDVVNVVPSLSLVFLGVGYYSTTATVGETLQTAVASAVALIGCVSVTLLVLWRYRDAVIDRVSTGLARVFARLRPGNADAAALEAELVERMHRFVEHIERLAVNRGTLATVFGFSLLGWLFQAAALTVAFAAMGHTISPAIAVFVIPLAYLAGAAPLPGGLGSIEAAFVALLVPTTGVAASTVTAAVLVYRGATYWMPVLVGGSAMSAFGVRRGL